MTMSDSSENLLSSFSFPRTGKRGVPQQFPRRLYEMLESETKLLQESKDHPKVISWSDSGRAFRIYDAAGFSNEILPLYFRTRKFSSFQRNLNLYGFQKVRRGPDTDMYAHPSFVKDQPESLLHLRKITNATRRRTVSKDTFDEETRPVSPSLSSSTVDSGSSPIMARAVITNIPRHISHPLKMTPKAKEQHQDYGRLDLLALALEQEAFMGV